MSVLIIGNIFKDVYLSLDERQNVFETDENGTPWMDVAFDGSHHSFFSRTSVFGGAAVTLEVLKKFGIDVEISTKKSDEESKIADSYRYILSSGDYVSYLTQSERTVTSFIAPNKPVDWIFIDRSAEISDELVRKVKNYIGLSNTKLAIFIDAKKVNSDSKIDVNSSAIKELMEISNVIFTDGELEWLPRKAAICTILNKAIKCDGIIRQYNVLKNDLFTHLTSYSIIAATIFGAMMNGMGTKKAIEAAVLNVENSKLSETLTKEELEKMLEERERADGNLRLIAKTLVAPGRGILAADESGGSIHKKFEKVGILDDEMHRRDYRNVLFSTRELNKYVNGVILFEETARQLSDDGRDFVSFLTSLGIVAGIKADKGLEPFSEAEYSSEKWTKGLDNLPERLAEYYGMGARFAKWRAAFEVILDDNGADSTVKTPSEFAIKKNCEILAEYARDCQNAGLVPIVEPEVVYDGYYPVEICAKITGDILDCLFEQLNKYGVDLESCILKTNMVLAGKKYKTQSTPEEVGKWTAEVLTKHCPNNLAGVVFLSGGQEVEQATKNLQAVTNNGPFPWPVTFSFARALQNPALEAWKGDNNNSDIAHEAFLARLEANCRALTKNDLS